MPERILKMGMVGGGKDAFIGAVHRRAACLDHGIVFTAGALSSTPQRALESGRAIGLDPSRTYESWQQMIERESALPPEKRIDFVTIVTPNDTHFPIAHAFVQAGFHVVCDKPLCHTTQQAAQLAAVAQKSNTLFAVTYNYTGYPMIKQARHMVADGQLGDIRKVIVEYNQGWLATKLETSGQKQADWRTDPSRSGLGGAIGDIGSHAEQIVSYITNLEIESLCADLTSFIPGRRLDDDASLLLRFSSGARGILTASQICVGQANDLRIRIWGTAGGLTWHQETPNTLLHGAADQPTRILRRGESYLCKQAAAATRLPSGHEEAFTEAFANVYAAIAQAIRAGAGPQSGTEFDYPDLTDGARGVKFIETTVQSAGSDAKWTPMN